MNRATPEMRSLAKDLVAYETASNKTTETRVPTVLPVAEKLRPHLANLMGIGGFRALLSRALVLASTDVAWLHAVRVKTDGTFDGLEGPHARLDPAEFLDGQVELLAQLFGLLVAFIGPNLTSRLVGEIWPEFHSATWDSAGKEVKREKAR
jgi:hypothetical protein